MSLLNKEQLDYFEEFGFLPLENVFDPVKVLDPIIQEYHGVLDDLIDDLYEEGRISSKFENSSFAEKLTKVMQETGESHASYFDFSLPSPAAITLESKGWFGPSVFNAFVDEDILDVVESIIGSEIYSNPVQHVRIKPPEKVLPKTDNLKVSVGATPWHQDQGVVNDEADETNMLTVWFPLLDAPIESGPLKVIPGSHKGGLLTHCGDFGAKGVMQIPTHLFDEEGAVPVPLNRGDLVIMNKRTVHGSLPNISDDIRWSFDLRYNPIGQNTGREAFPGFVARSRRDSSSELRDPAEWNNMWEETKIRLSSVNSGDPIDIGFRKRADGNQSECA